MRTIAIETERLLIRELRKDDALPMFEMERDAEVHKYLGGMPYTDVEQCRNYIQQTQQQYVDDGISRWAIVLKDNGVFIGRAGFKLMRTSINGHEDYYDFGFRLVRSCWCKGYGYESAHAVLMYGREVLKLNNIHAMTDVQNTGARHILQKTGFTDAGVFEYDGPPPWYKGQPIVWYDYE